MDCVIAYVYFVSTMTVINEVILTILFLRFAYMELTNCMGYIIYLSPESLKLGCFVEPYHNLLTFGRISLLSL